MTEAQQKAHERRRAIFDCHARIIAAALGIPVEAIAYAMVRAHGIAYEYNLASAEHLSLELH
jgi:hypothetical protein